MIKRVLLAFLVITFTFMNLCVATKKVDTDESNLAIGEMYIGSDIEEVIAILGPPTKQQSHYPAYNGFLGELYRTYEWKSSNPNVPSVYIKTGHGLDTDISKVTRIEIKGNKTNDPKYMTPAGIYQGMNVKELANIMGINMIDIMNDPERIKMEQTKSPKIYYLTDVCFFNPDHTQCLQVFLKNKTGIYIVENYSLYLIENH